MSMVIVVKSRKNTMIIKVKVTWLGGRVIVDKLVTPRV